LPKSTCAIAGQLFWFAELAARRGSRIHRFITA
jgi:hypothetical protein